jgi:hypothetical protein
VSANAKQQLAPTPVEQIAFLSNIERLLSEGQFVATYKYALLIAIADLAVQLGSDDGSELELPLRAIAEQFIELYWRQTAPYRFSSEVGAAGILLQSTGKQAKIISIVGDLQREYDTVMGARASPAWRKAITRTTALIEEMPLWRLQAVSKSETLDFLYKETRATGQIRLRAGVAANLRRFHGMIVRMARSEWMHSIQALPLNAPVLGATSDLGEFLFGADRTALMRFYQPLEEIQHGLCFYCAGKLGKAEIDHFIPWSRYPRDLAHNLVLADRQCNGEKSASLASERHLERWLQRNSDNDAGIIEAGRVANIIVDGPATIGVAAWAYAHNAAVGAPAWLSGEIVEPLSGRWRSLLAMRAPIQ